MPMKKSELAVPTANLRRVCEPVMIEEGEVKATELGQQDALDAMELGLEMMSDQYAQSHYNVLVVGSPNTGRTARTVQFLQERSKTEWFRPHDVIAVYDFDSPRRFIAAFVPQGRGTEIKSILDAVAKAAALQLPDEIEEFRNEQMSKAAKVRNNLLEEAKKKVAPLGLVVVQSEEGIGVLPLSMQNPEEPMQQQEYDQLEDDIREEIDQRRNQGTEILTKAMEKFGELVSQIMQGGYELAETKIEQMVKPIRDIIGDDEAFSGMGRYLDDLKQFLATYASKPPQQMNPISVMTGDDNSEQNEKIVVMHRCQARVLVDNSNTETRPVVHVDVPQFSRLFGRINAQPTGHDTLRVDHTMVEGGAFLEANGGYLVLDVDDLLRWGGGIAFYKLLEVIRTGKLTIESISSFVDAEGLLNFRSNEVPIGVRVIAVCSPRLEAILRNLEPEFENLFRIASEFSCRMDYDMAPQIYGRFVKLCCRQSDLPRFTPMAIAKLVEYGADELTSKASAQPNSASLRTWLPKPHTGRKRTVRPVFIPNMCDVQSRLDSTGMPCAFATTRNSLTRSAFCYRTKAKRSAKSMPWPFWESPTKSSLVFRCASLHDAMPARVTWFWCKERRK